MNIDNRGVVVSVVPGSPAAKDRVPPGARIVAVNGVPVNGKPDIYAQLGAGGAEAGSFLHGFLDEVKHFIISVTSDGRSPGTHIIHVLVPIYIPSIGTFHLLEYDWVTSN